jgi:hypothetical protein
MTENEVKEAMVQLRYKHEQQQMNLNYKHDMEIMKIQNECVHQFTEPIMIKYDFIQKECTICNLVRIIT